MSGLGRRTHYRKHLTDAVMYDLPEPTENERIAKVVATRGGNQFDVCVAATADAAEEEKQDTAFKLSPSDKGKPQLAILPTKFNKLVWLKRNDFVIVETGDGIEGNNHGGIRFIISHILYKDQIKNLIDKGLWPKDNPQFCVDSIAATDGSSRKADVEELIKQIRERNANGDLDAEFIQDDDEEEYDDYDDEESNAAAAAAAAPRRERIDDDGIVFDGGHDDVLFVNSNRIAALRLEDSESSDEDDG